MKKPPSPESFLPLKPHWFHVLLSLSEQEQHGYAIMQDVLERTDGKVRLWPPTLYGTIKRLIEEGASVCAHDPQAMDKVRVQFPQVDLGKDVYETARDAEALVVATEWEEFKTLDWERIRDTMARPLIFDARNLLKPATMKAMGFEYYSVGRPH